MANGIVASNFRPINKSTLIGSVDLEVTGWRLLFKECLYHSKNGKEWIAFPAREYTAQDGKRRFVDIINFTDDTVRARFQSAALQAVHAIAGGP